MIKQKPRLSRLYFIFALTAILATGGFLWQTLANFNQPPIASEAVTNKPREASEDTLGDKQSSQEESDQQIADVEETQPTPAQPTQTPAVIEEPPTTTSSLTCSDCTLAPVDKQASLPAGYTPATIATGLPGGGSLVASAQQALNDLFAAASAGGVELEVISAFRSYQEQTSTFNYWVSTELAKGLSQAQAEAAANTYSARPGHSEHQLGTTVDLKCAGCEAFNASQNATAYQFIANNAHLHGFAISYPQGLTAQTGYTYEPWHIRWIGADNATQLKNLGASSYLAQFLREL